MPADPVVSPAATIRRTDELLIADLREYAAAIDKDRGHCQSAATRWMRAAADRIEVLNAESDALLAVGERDRRDRDFYKRQLDAVDANLGPWESEAPDGCAVGRVQTILNLKADRERGERDRQHIAQLTEALREQWTWNHDEHCSSEWPHEGTCHWPLPVLLGGDPAEHRAYAETAAVLAVEEDAAHD